MKPSLPAALRPSRALSALALLACAFAGPAHAITLPTDFVSENAAPGVSWNTPVNIAFLPDGRMLVAEKRGRVYVVKNGVRHPTPVWSRESEVLNHHDRGLLGIAVDPNYASNRYMYFLFTVDADSNGSDGSEDAFGRLTRYQMSAADSNAVDPASRTVLLGVNWTNGPVSTSPSHTIGSVQFGADGSLLVTAGDGAQYTGVDKGGQDSLAFIPGRTNPLEDIGSFRSQYLSSLAGKVLRINPATGLGYPSNPFWDGNAASVASRVWAYGVRNPYRFTVRPGTGSSNPASGDPGSLYIGDVGWGAYEEVNVSHGGENFGWPCFEGFGANNQYQAATPAHHDCSTIGTPQNPSTHTQPVIAWHHSNPANSTPPGIEGNTVTGGVFYEGNRYPMIYRGRFFFADYTDDWIRTADFDQNDVFLGLQDFAFGADGPVAIALSPTDRTLYYVAIKDGEVRRIRYTGPLPNTPPVAAADVSPSVGVLPLAVNFSSAGSFDEDGDPLAYSWAFGDGNGSNDPNPAYVYMNPGLFEAVLTVSDTAGALARDTVSVVVSASGGFPTTTVLDQFNRPNGPVGGAWIGDVSGLSIGGNTLVPVSGGLSVTWDGAIFGPNQEAFVTFDALSAGAPEHDLMLKVQGTSGSSGHIEVRYDDSVPLLAVGTFHPVFGWQGNATFPVTFGAGDQLGARAYQDGTVEVFKNGALLGSTSVDFWPFFANSGRIGMTLVGATSSVLDDFGGGDVVLDPNTAPAASMMLPVDSTFFAAGDTVWMSVFGADAEQATETLTYRLEADLHHNTHIHPNSIVIDDSTGYFIAENHDDGTGVWFELRGIVTDSGGMSDTSTVSVFPEIDLAPGGFSADVPQLGDDDTATWTFRIYNRGAMPAPLFHWSFIADGAQLLAEGDTLIAAGDSVTVIRTLPPTLSAGMHSLRIAVDTLGAVVETSEVNNAFTGTIEVVPGNGTVAIGDAPVRELSLSNAYPNPSTGSVGFALALPRATDVSFAVLDVQGREVWQMPERAMQAGRVHLTWSGAGARGERMRPGLYLARVRAGDVTLVRRFVVLR